MSFKPLQEYLPPLKARGMTELAGAKRATIVLWYKITVGAATSYALSFTDAEGNAVELADTDYVVHPVAEGTICEPDESTKTTRGVTILSKDYTGAAANFANALNVTIHGRLADQPATQL